MTQKLARIKKIDFGMSDYGLSINIEFQLGTNTRQGTGTYLLNNAEGGPFLSEIMTQLGVSKLEEAVGKDLFVLYEDDDHNGRIIGFELLPFERKPGLLLFKDFLEKQEKLRGA